MQSQRAKRDGREIVTCMNSKAVLVLNISSGRDVMEFDPNDLR